MSPEESPVLVLSPLIPAPTSLTGQQVTFAVTTSATASPFVSLNCYQNGVWVYTASAGFFAAYPWSQKFTLSSTAWMSGAADCTARLYSTKTGTRTTTLATANFHVFE